MILHLCRRHINWYCDVLRTGPIIPRHVCILLTPFKKKMEFKFLPENWIRMISFHPRTEFVSERIVSTLIFRSALRSRISDAVHESVPFTTFSPVLHVSNLRQVNLFSLHPSSLYPSLPFSHQSPLQLSKAKCVSPFKINPPSLPF